MIFQTMTEDVSPVIEAIFSHPFQQSLAKGTLSQAQFLEYLRQDSLYLIDFSKALTLVSARLPHDFSSCFLKLALGAIEAERELHHRYLTRHQGLWSVDKNPACFAYTHYLLSMAALGTIEEAVASLVPCFWIYQIVGEYIAKIAIKPNPFDIWIDAYASPSFKEAVDSIVDVMNVLASSASLDIQEKMRAAFRRASMLEWFFWDDAYRGSSFEARIFE